MLLTTIVGSLPKPAWLAEPGQLRALQGLTGWQVYYFVGNAWSNAQSTGNLVVTPAASASQATVVIVRTCTWFK